MEENSENRNPRSFSVETVALAAREAAAAIARAPSSQKNDALCETADILEESYPLVMESNEKDLADATDLGFAMQDRLELTDSRYRNMVEGLRLVANLEDAVG